jgi:Carboxypeptidase regulatory-like domain
MGPANLWRVLFLLCALLPSVANCQGVSDLASANSNAKSTVGGTVVNAVTGEPIRRALVQLNGMGEHLALTDSSGQFEFADLPPGGATVVVRKPGFFSIEEVNQGRTGPMSLTIGPDVGALSLKLFPQSVIYGHVKNPEGEPIESVQVRAIAAQIVEGRKRWQMAGSASTNEDGEFRIANLRPGSYRIEAEPNQSPRLPKGRKEGYAAAFYPTAPDMTSAMPLQIALGQQADIELSLHPVPLYSVSGSVVGNPPNTSAQIMFVDQSGNRFYALRRFDMQTGQFEAEIPPGSYTLEALAWLPEGKQLRGEVPVNVTRDVADIAVALTATLPTPIMVRAENTKPAAQTNGEINAANLVNIHLIPIGNSITAQEYWSAQQGNPKPSLVLPDVPPGTYSVELQPSGSWYVQSAQCGSTDLLREPLTVSAGTQIPQIDVVLRNDGGTVKGRIGTGPKQTWATVVLIPEHGFSNQIKTANAGPDGNFFVSGVTPGSYTALAFDRATVVEYANPNVIAQYASHGAPVTILPNGESQVSLALIQEAD